VVTQDAVKTVRGSATTLVSSTYTDNLYGQVSTVETATQTNGGTPVDSETRYYYFTFDGASETASVYYSPNLAGPPVTYVTGYAYDGLGRLKEIDVSDGHPRTLLYQSDLTGQIIRRDQVGTAPHEVHYYFDGIQIGDVSNNGAGSDLDYAQEIADRVATQGGGQFHNGTNVAVAYANFDQSYDPLNGYDANASSSYTVVGGDTLQSIAQVVWGDGTLWYLIANANGLSGDDTLTAGMSLIIPNNVINVHNNATTFKPYDPNSAIGYVDPTVPKKASSCGMWGQIILAVIAVVVTVVTWGGASGFAAGLLGVDATSSTVMVLAADALGGAMAGAAGNLASHAFGLATGLQKSFNWGGLAMAAIGGAVGGGIGGTGWAADLTESLGSFASGAITGAVGSIVTQGIGVATGLQKKFDWAGVAAAGIGGGVSSAITANASSLGISDWSPTAVRMVAGMAGDIANAATRTLVNGTDFGDNLISALPDTIGSTIGGLLLDNIKYAGISSQTPPDQQTHGDDPPGPRDYSVQGDESNHYIRISDNIDSGIGIDVPHGLYTDTNAELAQQQAALTRLLSGAKSSDGATQVETVVVTASAYARSYDGVVAGIAGVSQEQILSRRVPNLASISGGHTIPMMSSSHNGGLALAFLASPGFVPVEAAAPEGLAAVAGPFAAAGAVFLGGGMALGYSIDANHGGPFMIPKPLLRMMYDDKGLPAPKPGDPLYGVQPMAPDVDDDDRNNYPWAFGQRRADPTFSTKPGVPPEIAGKRLDVVADMLRSGQLSPDVIRIQYYVDDMSQMKVSLNTRGLAVLGMAGISPTNTEEVPYSSLTGGQLNRFRETPIIPSPIPGPLLPITPNVNDTTIMTLNGQPWIVRAPH
jgi:hypothetical protein